MDLCEKAALRRKGQQQKCRIYKGLDAGGSRRFDIGPVPCVVGVIRRTFGTAGIVLRNAKLKDSQALMKSKMVDNSASLPNTVVKYLILLDYFIYISGSQSFIPSGF